jgi:hypothetical protein
VSLPAVCVVSVLLRRPTAEASVARPRFLGDRITVKYKELIGTPVSYHLNIRPEDTWMGLDRSPNPVIRARW